MEIFVGNLAFDLTRKELVDCFCACGEIVKVRMLFDKDSRFRGIAYIEFAEDSQARQAIQTMNGVELKGRVMKVDFSRPIRPRFNGFGGAFGKKERPKRIRKIVADPKKEKSLVERFKPKFQNKDNS